MKPSKLLQNINPDCIQFRKEINYYVTGQHLGEIPISKEVVYCKDNEYNKGFMFSGKGFDFSKKVVISSAWKMI
ncbi:hypothetical protein [Culicoidibacter larvae]|uniref:Uncharacterized protein n=1 Tax=Culicoidibacter larvae TaxID=2579976 RepID=A0A5R8Q8W8_9FIRM|nr:hypothetical protein [Culicoidibacter larvae]TLG72065.1 hypothetical protein FEZ08_09535 [Culicoidibacter larvae]